MRRTPRLIPLTAEEIEIIKEQASALGKSLSFSTEEMQAIREQYELHLLDEEQRREQLEYHLKLALARLKDVEDALKGIEREDPRTTSRRSPFVAPKRARA